VVMDIRLIGQRDGIDAAIEICRNTGIRCVFATAHRDTQTLARAEAAAPLGWLTKPYTRDMLVETVKRALTKLRS
jgi:two-component system, response regulator PdtaR